MILDNMTALELVKSLRDAFATPRDDQNRGLPSNGQLRRWLEQGSVLINGERLRPGDLCPAEVHAVIFFPGSPRQTSIPLSLQFRAYELPRRPQIQTQK